MDYIPIHNFNLTIKEMESIQVKLGQGIVFKKLESEPRVISGVDAVYTDTVALCVIVTFDYQNKKLLEFTYAVGKNNFYYKSGLLAFHELPSFLQAWSNLTIEPDLVVFDGYGYAHLRRVGLATHASFFIQKPTFGIAKTPFIGKYSEPDTAKGSYSYIRDNNEVIGAVVRSCENKKPIFVSVGNYCTLSEVIDISLLFSEFNNRIPLLTALPDQFSKKLKFLLN